MGFDPSIILRDLIFMAQVGDSPSAALGVVPSIAVETGAVLTAVARIVADALSLQDVVSRLVEVLRPVIPFERLHVLRLDRAEAVVLYSAQASGELEIVGHRIGDPRVAPPNPALDSSSRSVLICPMRQGGRVPGALWVTSSVPNAFTEAHHTIVEAVADLITVAVHHEALRSTETVRRERIESLDRLLQKMAESLDVRMVFNEISEVVRGGLPHDILALTSWAEDGRSFRVYALAGTVVNDDAFWSPITLEEGEKPLLHRESYIIRDATTELPRDSVHARMFAPFAVKSALRVPLPLGGDVFGSLFFLSRESNAFEDDDLDYARRVADHLALALSLQRLAVVARRDAEARATAARLEAQVATLTRELEARTGQRRVIGSTRRWKDVLTQAARVAQTETTVLLTGESGTGKEVIARFIHHGSKRSNGPFIAINCAALPDQLLESELFGHERGAFTGAVAAKPGRIEQANGGVLFLDEVGEMSPAVQAKVLRVLEQREFLRLGGTRLLRADIRVIAATNRDLLSAIRRGEFREDLYYRLGVFEITLPPLRERPEDILELADSFLDEIGQTVGRPAAGIAREARDQLVGYHWPGNVRELRNAIERAVILADGGYIRPEHLPVTAPRAAAAAADVNGATALPAGGVNLEAIERSLVVKALAQARHNKTRAAKLLGLTRAQLYTRIEKYGLAEPES
jgi:transcriptional regulator with GAF, ATPase, and Fis domain